MIELGQKVRDRVTGFEGVATSKVEYLNGCVQYCVKPRVGEDNKMVDGEYVDVQQLEVIDDVLTIIANPIGGIMSDVPRDTYSTG